MPSLPTFMSNKAWLLKGYKIVKGNANTRTDKASGVARQRRKRKCVSDTISVAIHCSLSELAQFEDFYYNEIDGGTLEFTGHYYDGAGRSEGVMQIVGGKYTKRQLTPNSFWLGFNVVVKNRQPKNTAQLDEIIMSGRDVQAVRGYIIDNNGNYVIGNNGNKIPYTEYQGVTTLLIGHAIYIK